MRANPLKASVLAAGMAAALAAVPVPAKDLAPTFQKSLAEAKYVYIASQRKDGSFGAPAEIWFFTHEGRLWVASPPTAWRVRRIKAGRTAAKIAIGTPDGPSFDATGTVVMDAAVSALMFEAFAKKYPEGWPKYEARFREGLRDGSRVLIRYVPTD